jgi:type IV secretion system protein VirB9
VKSWWVPGRSQQGIPYAGSSAIPTSGAGGTKRVHILVKPTRPDLITNLIVNTDRRSYLAELRATPTTYMASVSWDYPRGRPDCAASSGRATLMMQLPVDAGLDLNAH